MKVAIIPARGGSKRIPEKNIKSFCGKPMISYSIRAALESGLFDKVIVSTDSDRIAEVARAYGAEVPFVRPQELANDFTIIADVVDHSIQWLSENVQQPEYVCCIFATSPLLQSSYISKGFNLMQAKGAPAVCSVTTFAFPIFRALRIGEDGTLSMFWKEYEKTRSNDLPEAVHDAGQFYWLRTTEFLKEKRMWPTGTLPVVLPRYLVQDIDTPEDWETAELLFEAVKLRESKHQK